jgi:hypothetical protein
MSDLNSSSSLFRVREVSAGFKAATVILVGLLVAVLLSGISLVATACYNRASTRLILLITLVSA